MAKGKNGSNGATAVAEAATTPTVATLLRENHQLEETVELVYERLAELELAIEDEGWRRIDGDMDRELSRDALRKIARLSRLAFLKNPLINRAVSLQSMYVWGQGLNIKAKHPDVQAVLDAFLDDVKNQAELTSHQARTLKEIDLQVEGNVFFVFFVDPSTGHVRLRTVPPDEVVEIVTNPDDSKDVWFYRREWTERALELDSGKTKTTKRVAFYPDWRHTPTGAERPNTIGAAPVLWESPVYHLKVGGMSDMRFGVPETYAAIDWARAYKSFLEDWATIVRSLSRFAWNLTAKGGAKGVAAARTKLGSTLASGGDSAETNPPPVTGSTFIAAEGYKLDPIRTSGATTSADDGRRMLLMVAAATGLPESFFGDVSVGTLATAKSLDRPTELKFRDRQTLWGDVLHDILQYVVDQAVRAPGGGLEGTVTQQPDGTIVVTMAEDPETGEPLDRFIDVSFPPILEHDRDANVNAVVAAATLNGHPDAGILDRKMLVRMLLAALGEDDIDELLHQMFPEDAPDAEPPAGALPPPEEAFTEAVRELRDALRTIAKEPVQA